LLASKFNENKPLTLGILGGGQLAKMIEIAGYPMGINFSIIENGENTPAGDMTQLEFTSGWKNKEDLDTFIEVSDIITLENEFIEPEILEYIEERKIVYPSSKTMRLVRDKYIQKTTFVNAGLEVADFQEINSIDEGIKFGNKYGFPFVLKAREFSYDGYGNAKIDSPEGLKNAWSRFNSNGISRSLYAEKFIPFKKELAVMVVRKANGNYAIYPCVETIQKNHICHKVIAPANISDNIGERAKSIALKCIEAINGVGVFGVELFLTEDDNLLVNEIAPRPHNSGHYTIEGSYTSQFENCIRAVLDLPLGSTEMIRPVAVMINILGERTGSGVPTNVINLLSNKKAKLHLYGKKSSRVGRKMGHVTVIGDNYPDTLALCEKAVNELVW